MKKYVLPFMLLLIFILQPVYGEEKIAEQRVTVFIDISGSMYPVFSEIKQAVLDEVFSDLEIGTELTIYKFYRKIVPIYEGRLKRKSDIDYAKSRVLALKANGPWTDIQKVFAHIQEHQTENDRYFIFTDGKHETEDGLHDFQLTETMLKEQLGNNVKVIQKDAWEMIDYVYKPVVVQKQPEVITPPVQDTKEPIKPPVPVEVVQEKASFNLWWLIWIILIILAVIVVILLLRAKANSAVAHTDTADIWNKMQQAKKLNDLLEAQQKLKEQASEEDSNSSPQPDGKQPAPDTRQQASSRMDRLLDEQTRNYKALEEEIKKGQPPLTDDEQNVANTWTGDSYLGINNSLRYPQEIDSYEGYDQINADILKKIMEKTSMPAMILQRITDGEFLEKIVGKSFKEITANPAMLKGITVQDKGFTATSSNKNSTFPVPEGKPVRIFIESPDGQKGLLLEPYTQHHGEHEILLPPNTQIKIMDAKLSESGELSVYAKIIK